MLRNSRTTPSQNNVSVRLSPNDRIIRRLYRIPVWEQERFWFEIEAAQPLNGGLRRSLSSGLQWRDRFAPIRVIKSCSWWRERNCPVHAVRNRCTRRWFLTPRKGRDTLGHNNRDWSKPRAETAERT
jgi:hypothetical protein